MEELIATAKLQSSLTRLFDLFLLVAGLAWFSIIVEIAWIGHRLEERLDKALIQLEIIREVISQK